jgi:hypothetical protein
MQLLAADGTRIGGEAWTLAGDGKQSRGAGPSPAFARQCFLKEFPYEGVDGGAMLGSVGFRLANQVGGQTEGDVPILHVIQV